MRVAMEDTDATLAVFKGDVEVTGPSGTVQLGKKQTATFDLANQDKYTLAKNLDKDPYDAWDKQQEDYHQRYWEGEGQRNPYCLAVIPPKLAKLRKSFAARSKAVEAA